MSLNYKYILFITFIIIGSFFSFSLKFNPITTSDDALNVLIAHTYSLPHDVYCWEQDRGGTLIPLIAQPFMYVFNCSALTAVSISNFFVLTLGFIGFSSLFKNKKTILLFAILWFFPFQRLININQFPIGMGYSLIGFSMLFVRQLNWERVNTNWMKNVLLLMVVFISWCFAIWTSDLALVTCSVLLGSYLVHHFIQRKSHHWLPVLVTSFIGIAGLLVVRAKLKTYATGVTSEFSTLNTFSDIVEAVKLASENTRKLLFFESDDSITSLGAWIVLMGFITMIILCCVHARKLLSAQDPWHTFLVIDFAVSFGILFVAHWVLLNRMGNWYFVAPYISGTIALLLFFEKSSRNLSKKYFSLAVILAIFLGSSNFNSVLFKMHGQYKPMSQTIAELDKLGKIGIIGNYWDAYRMSMVHPEKVMSTAREGDVIRNHDRIHQVFEQPNIFLSKDMWFEVFPDSIQQFGVMLYKNGNELKIGGSTVCKYAIKLGGGTYWVRDGEFPKGYFNAEKNELQIPDSSQELMGKHLVYGQSFHLKKGKYRIRYYCDYLLKNNQAPILLDISSEYGQRILKQIRPKSTPNEQGFVEIPIELDRFERNIETRVLYIGGEAFRMTKVTVLPY